MLKISAAAYAALVALVLAHGANACTITDNRNGAQCQGICAPNGRPLQCTTPWYFPRPHAFHTPSIRGGFGPYGYYPKAGYQAYPHY